MALLALAPACGFRGEGGTGGTTDTGLMCFGTLVSACFPTSAIPTAPRILTSTDIDTDLTARGSLCNQDNDLKAKYCVVAGSELTLGAGETLTAHGSRPLVLLSTTTMDLLGDIDVSSHHAGQQLRGAGANPGRTGACSFTTAPTEAVMGGGGYGASLGTVGGGGGNAAMQVAGGGLAGPRLESFPVELRGGCKGGDGSGLAGSSAAAGDGGGAIALIAPMQIHVDAMINASGGAGHGGAMSASNGGGGGGAGGMILFDSLVPLTFGARTKLWANGGGGAQGGSAEGEGADGNESTGPMQAASGGSGSSTGGSGGAGSVGGSPGVAGASVAGGGGGGGGGAGFIYAPGFTELGSISPPSSNPPRDP
jgi:hypothetical protein